MHKSRIPRRPSKEVKLGVGGKLRALPLLRCYHSWQPLVTGPWQAWVALLHFVEIVRREGRARLLASITHAEAALSRSSESVTRKALACFGKTKW